MNYYPKFVERFYKRDFKNQIKNIEKSEYIEVKGKCMPFAILTPHASIEYSGRVALSAFEQIKWKEIDRVVILGTYHNTKKDSGWIIPAWEKIDFLGTEIKVDVESVKEFKEIRPFRIDKENAFEKEHSWEVQIPFLIYKEYKGVIFPILIGETINDNDKVIEKMMDRFLYDNKTVVILTIDLTHYGKQYGLEWKLPRIMIKEKIKLLDNKMIKAIIEKNEEEFKEAAISTDGMSVIMLWIKMMKMNKRKMISRLVALSTSSEYLKEDEEDENFTSVSYTSIVFEYENCMNKQNNTINVWKKAKEDIAMIPIVTILLFKQYLKYFYKEEEREVIQFQSYQQIENIWEVIRTQVISTFPMDEKYNEYGVFVSYYDNKELQGSIGIFSKQAKRFLDIKNINNESKWTLLDLVALYTLNAVFLDSRFDVSALRYIKNYEKLCPKEDTEISTNENSRCPHNPYEFVVNILKPDLKIPNHIEDDTPDMEAFFSMYVPCKHGITLKVSSRLSATYLPSVMSDQGWILSCKTTLSNEEKDRLMNSVFPSLIRKMYNIPYNITREQSIEIYGIDYVEEWKKRGTRIEIYETILGNAKKNQPIYLKNLL